MSQRVFAAVDLGASSGRVIAGIVDGEQVTLELMHRFPNSTQQLDGNLRWNLSGLYEEILLGLAALGDRYPQVESIGIDTWGVDYGLLDSRGALLGEPIAYRDERTAAVVDEVHERVSPAELYGITGIQFLPLNTIYQLAAEQHGPLWSRACTVVMLPDLIAYWLTGELRAEYTNATTTGLVDARTRDWSVPVLDRLGIPSSLLPAIEQPGAVRGALRPEVRERVGLPTSVVVTAVGSHDTASAVAAVPASASGFAYVSSGTWSLVGTEVGDPILDDEAQAANFTNEGGIDGRIRFLRNVGGFWLLEESLRTWEACGERHDLAQLLAEAAAVPPGARIDVDDPELVAPGDMPTRIARAAGFDTPPTAAEITRCIVDSLADAYAATAEHAIRLSGTDLEVIHLVGGGSQSALLCQLTADAAEVDVTAGPTEATALGNLLVQARAHGALVGSIDDLRVSVARHHEVRRYKPHAAIWK